MYLSRLGAIFTIHMYMIFFLIYVFTLFRCYMYYLCGFNIFWDWCISQFGYSMKWNWQIHQLSVQQDLAYMTEYTRTTICDVMLVIDIYFTIYTQKHWIIRAVKLDDFWVVPTIGSFSASWKETPVLRKKRTLNDVDGAGEIKKRFEYHQTTNCQGIYRGKL